MNSLYNFKRLALVALALVAFLFTAQSADAQYQRGIWLEEFTGTWCQYCPRGAFYMDSVEHHMPDHAVIISWHGPYNSSDPYKTKQHDTVFNTWGLGGWPNLLMNRWDYKGGMNFFAVDDPLYTDVIQEVAKQPPVLNIELANVKYNPASRTAEFDLKVSPRLGAQFIPSEDTAEYRYIVIFTEDSLIYDQTNAFPQWPNPIKNFRNDNVPRQIVGSVLGNKFDMGTISPKTYPLVFHHSIKLTTASWKANKMQIKAAVLSVAPVGTTPQAHIVYNAAETNYLTTYPVPANITITKPAFGESIAAGTQDYPITWTSSAGITTNKKIEFSNDNGATWTKIADLTTDVNTYAWDVPATGSAKNFIRITDANNVVGTSEMFAIFKPAIIISKPYDGNVLNANEATDINFTSTAGVTTNKKIEYSLDNGATWTKITDLTSEVNTYSWMVPDVETTQGMIRITDESAVPIIGESGVFTIQKGIAPKPGFKTLSMSGVTNGNIPFNTATVFSWTFENGTVPGPYDIEMSTDNKATWTKVANAAQGTNQVDWTTPPSSEGFIPSAFFRITNHTSEVSQTFTTATSISIGNDASVKNNGGTPTAFRLSTNYPNPFTSVTNINFDIPEHSFVTLVVRNELGQEVARLVSGMLDAGTYTADFDATKLPAGLYTYTLESGATKLAGKMSVVR